MKNKKQLTAVFIIFIIASFLPLFTYAGEASHETFPRELIDGIIDYKKDESGAADIQAYINGALTDSAGVTAEWYILALCADGVKADYSGYARALAEYVSENGVPAGVTRQKYALAMLAAGYYCDYVKESAASDYGTQGIMSCIFALHISRLLTVDGFSVEDTFENLLSMKLSDGGWALGGETSNTDVTAMAIQALAPYYKSNADVKQAVDRALVYLSENQLKNGGYISYGAENPESASQVIIALTSLGIDPLTDERFVKNESSLLDFVNGFRLENGSYEHQNGKGTNNSATYQALCAFVALDRFYGDKGAFYEFTDEERVYLSGANESANEEKDAGYKLYACIAIGGVALAVCAVLLALKKRSPKNFFIIALVSAALIAVVLFTNIQSADGYYGESSAKKNPTGSVTLSITCESLSGKVEDGIIPADGILLQPQEFEIEAGDTVYDILTEAAKKNRLQLDIKGSKASGTVYVAGIAYIYEFDYGALSGWTYCVNGRSPSVGCAGYELSDGDVVEWIYSVERR